MKTKVFVLMSLLMGLLALGLISCNKSAPTAQSEGSGEQSLATDALPSKGGEVIGLQSISCQPSCPAQGSGAAGVAAFTAACAACGGADNPATTCNNEFTIELINGAPTRNGDLVTFTYEVCRLAGARRALSHWTIGLGQIDCLGAGKSLADLLVSCTFNGSNINCVIGIDPSTLLFGVKFDVGFQGQCATFSVTLDESAVADGFQIGTGTIVAATKAGNQDITRSNRATPGYVCVLGPVCVPDDCPPPIITCPPDVTVKCDESTDPSNTGQATATSECGIDNIGFSDKVTPGACPQEKTITRTWTATDVNGKTASCVQIITVVDTTPPVITCPADVTLKCGSSTDPSNTGTATATDNCDPSPSITFSDQVSGSGDCTKETVTITRTWVATDACGNSSSCTQKIIVNKQ